MKIRVAIVLLALACLGGYITTVWGPSGPVSKLQTAKQASTVSAVMDALSGVWEGLGPEDLPVCLVVKDIRQHWATVTYSWGNHSDGRLQKGWVRVRALVFPDGKLFWRHPGDFTFQLSDDWNILVGKREQGGGAAYSLMRRASAERALTALRAVEGE